MTVRACAPWKGKGGVRSAMAADALYHSLIMRPVDPAEAFAGIGPLAYDAELSGLDAGCLGAALWDFLCLRAVSRLYIVGCGRTHAPLFFRDLRAALLDESEVAFSVGPGGSMGRKTVVYLSRGGRRMVFDRSCERAVVFPPVCRRRYRYFNRDALCAFLFCANGEYGPEEGSRCCNPLGRLCVKSFLSRELCGVCFHRPASRNMAEPQLGRLIDALELVDVDEGVVVEPLGVPKEVYGLALDDDSDLDINLEDLQISDSE